MPLQATSGAASYDAFGGGVPVVPNYIEDVFSTYLYTGNAGTQTVTNGIDLSTKGGMVWIKSRSGAFPHNILDTVRGFNYSGTQTRRLDTAATDTEADAAGNATQASPLTNGFSVTTSGGGAINFYNASGSTYASWTFRKQPKFFDVVTWTGNGPVTHNLGTTPGFWVYKDLGVTSDWFTLARKSDGTYEALYLNKTDATAFTGANAAAVGLTATTFDPSLVFGSAAGRNYVAYAFAHNAGGFGLTGTDNVISCGSYTGNGSTSGPSITLGYEPQWILIKDATDAGPNWAMFDNMRGIATGGTEQRLYANTSGAEATTGGNDIDLTATGFDIKTDLGYLNTSGSTYIYIAIRRGPMKVPTSGTSVYQANTYTGNATANTTVAGSFGFPVDLLSLSSRDATAQNFSLYGQYMIDRLQGQNVSLGTSTTTANTTGWGTYNAFDVPNSIGWGLYGTNSGTNYMNNSGGTFVARGFRRAPSFFDVVCYTGNSTAGRAINHNLGVAPELLIVKRRSGADSWYCYAQPLGNTYDLLLDSTRAASNADDIWYSTSPTSTTFTVRQYDAVNGSGQTYVAYLFASCPGVQYINSYVGDGTTGRTINCGFTGGARFVCIKATSTSGSWWTFDSARGIVTNSDPALQLNSTAAEITSADAIDTAASGFIVNQEATCSLNASGVTYLVWAIA